MLTNRKRIKLPRHPPTMSPVFTPNNYAPLYHALLANGNIHLFVSTNRSSPPISWPITARLRFKPRRLGCDPREPGSGTRGAPWNMIRDHQRAWSHFLWSWSSDQSIRAQTTKDSVSDTKPGLYCQAHPAGLEAAAPLASTCALMTL